MKPARAAWAIALSAVGIAGVSFVLQRRIGLNLGDEGYLWYGARQTVRGKVPVRDFQSYDPGRYDWCAAVMRLRGDQGILTLRLACHAFEIGGLAAALAVIGRSQANPVVRSLWGVICLTWMFPLFRTFETALASCAVLMLTRLLERPTPLRHFQTGLSIGIAGYFGRNHGAYQLAAYLTATACGLPPSSKRDKTLALLAAGSGIVAGYAPVLVKCATVPRFAAALFDIFFVIARTGSTNVTIDLPWPFARGKQPATPFEALMGCLFVALPVAYGSVMALRAVSGERFVQSNPALFAAACVGLPYAHQAFSRADLHHLASSIHPLLFALTALPRAVPDRRLGRVLDGLSLAGAAAFTAVAATRMTPLVVRARSATPYRDVAAGADTLSVDEGSARLIEAGTHAGVLAGKRPRALYVATAPAIYAMLDREAPVFDIYWALPTGVQHEDEMIADFDANEVEWVIAEDTPLDGLEARRVFNSHARFWHGILANFHRVPQPRLPSHVLILRRDSDADPPPSATIAFDAAGVAEQLVTGIFREGRSDGAWASGTVHLKLGMPPGTTALHVNLFAPPGLESAAGAPQRLRCWFPDGTAGDSGQLPAGLHEIAFDLPAAARAARTIVVRLEAAWTIIPSAAGINADLRELSVLLVRAEIR